MKMMETYVKQQAVVLSLAVIDMKLFVKDINPVTVEDDENVEPECAPADSRC